VQSKIQNPKSKIVIAGAGPAGSGLAIRLAQSGFNTVLIEREHFPRPKLCGEFISPECFRHFKELGVLEDMLAAGGDRIVETRFFETGGRSVTVPTNWFGNGDFALSLSRREMDNRLLERAKGLGVEVHDGTMLTDVEYTHDVVQGVRVRSSTGDVRVIAGDFFVDATGRAGALSKSIRKKKENSAAARPSLVGFKTHVRDADIARGVCEIYSFAAGYAGLSNVEGEVANLCFLIDAAAVRSIGGDPNEVVDDVVRRNRRANVTLRNIASDTDWLAVAIEGFGTQTPAPASNLVTIGDAASFIDPFTGSGMVMALESSELLAHIIASEPRTLDAIAPRYLAAYRKRFANRLRICSSLRRAAFMPRVATATVSLLGVSGTARRYIARATRK
jgi:menaquinone-9 beta-reductase